MAKKFFFVCGGILMLALAYHFGAQSASAQVGSQPVGFVVTGINWYVITANGDVFARGATPWSGSASYVGNYWGTSGPTPAQPASFGAIKAKFHR